MRYPNDYFTKYFLDVLIILTVIGINISPQKIYMLKNVIHSKSIDVGIETNVTFI